jgi:predicted MPP superfamily phosphohydrolase
VEIRDFRSVRHFPGTEGNPFDRVLRRVEALQALSWPIFSLLLLLLSWIPSANQPARLLAMLAIYHLDWLLLGLLPRAGVSYGPPRPSALLLALMRLPFAFLPLPVNLAFQTLGTLLVVYAFWIEPQRIRLTHQVLTSPKLTGQRPIRVLHLGDLHLERISRRERDLQRYIDELQPDLILFSGDVLNLSFTEEPEAIRQAQQVIQGWRAPAGVFLVSGSEAVDLAHVFPGLVEPLAAHWLDNQVATVDVAGSRVQVIGLTCSHRPHLDEPVLDQLLAECEPGFKILLYHSPDLAPNASQKGIDLQLSGHTHGGQVCLPLVGPLFTASLYGRAFRSGRYQLGDLTLYITRGIGLEGRAAPRVRFLCPPEIILWELRPQSPSPHP